MLFITYEELKTIENELLKRVVVTIPMKGGWILLFDNEEVKKYERGEICCQS